MLTRIAILSLIMQKYFLLLLCTLALIACKNDGKLVIIPDNNAPPYSATPSILVENYVNRCFIDLVGREPTDAEMTAEVAVLKSANLSVEARNTFIHKLQTSTQWVVGDSSYKTAYYKRLYELFKARLLEGASADDIAEKRGPLEYQYFLDSLAGDWAAAAISKDKLERLNDIERSEYDLREGRIDVREVHARMCNNEIYDFINMNSFNYIRATFNDLFGRYPTQEEFDQAFPVIEYNQAGVIFGQSCSNKTEYIRILVNSREFHEGMIRWAYYTLLQRNPQTAEVASAIQDFYSTRNLLKVQADIMATDEYAGFVK